MIAIGLFHHIDVSFPYHIIYPIIHNNTAAPTKSYDHNMSISGIRRGTYLWNCFSKEHEYAIIYLVAHVKCTGI